MAGLSGTYTVVDDEILIRRARLTHKAGDLKDEGEWLICLLPPGMPSIIVGEGEGWSRDQALVELVPLMAQAGYTPA